MEKLEHISTMFNTRTKRKKYENYIVNAIYNRVGNFELMPITQQYVRSAKDPRKYYLMDLYFPQINYGIEVDEMQHTKDYHIISDEERAEAIRDAIGCEEKRIELYHKVEEGNATMRSFDEIEADICTCVEEIKELIKKKEEDTGSSLKWQTNEEKQQEIFKNGILRNTDDVNFTGFTQIAEKLGFKLYRRCGCKLSNNYYLWVPHLAVYDDGKLYGKDGWENTLSEDRKKLTEVDTKDKLASKPNVDFTEDLLRVVFMKMKDKYGKPCCRFIGVYKPISLGTNARGLLERTYEKVSDCICIDKIRK